MCHVIWEDSIVPTLYAGMQPRTLTWEWGESGGIAEHNLFVGPQWRPVCLEAGVALDEGTG